MQNTDLHKYSFSHPTQADWCEHLGNLRRVGPIYQGPCPICGGTDRFRVNPDGKAFCRQCLPDGKNLDRLKLLKESVFGPDSPFVRKPKAPPPKSPPSPSNQVTRWDCHTRDDRLAIHCRRDPGKRIAWEQKNGRKGLPQGIGTADLLYLRRGREGATQAIVAEGEKAADALREVLSDEWHVIGTVCGASSVPTAEVLAWATEGAPEITLFPDADPPGQQHMEKVARQLGRPVRWVSTEGMADKADAADLAPDEIQQRVEEAQEIEVESPLTGGEPRVDPAPAHAPRWAPTERGWQWVFPDKSPESLSGALDQLGYEIRFEVRGQRIQLRHRDGDWETFDKFSHADLRHQIAKRFSYQTRTRGISPLHFGRDRFDDHLHAILHHRRVDSFREWLEALPEWDGVERLWLDDLFGCGRQGLARWASQAILLGAIERAFEPGKKIDTVVVLVGPQGTGKSTALAHLLPPDHPEWFSDELHLAERPKPQVEALQGRVLVEIGDMAGGEQAEKHNLQGLKAFLSRTTDRVRLSYRPDPEDFPRRCIFVATADHYDCLPNDPAGNRRFVPIDVPQGNPDQVRRYLPTHLLQLWAEALAAYFRGQRSCLPPELHAEQRAATEAHRQRDDVIEDKVDQYLVYLGGDSQTPRLRCEFELNDLLTACRIDDRDAKRVTRALRQRGYRSVRRRIESQGVRRRAMIWELQPDRYKALDQELIGDDEDSVEEEILGGEEAPEEEEKARPEPRDPTPSEESSAGEGCSHAGSLVPDSEKRVGRVCGEYFLLEGSSFRVPETGSRRLPAPGTRNERGRAPRRRDQGSPPAGSA